MPRFISYVLNTFTVCTFLVFSYFAYATISLPPTLSEVVDGSENVGLVRINKAEVYEVDDVDGIVPCGIIYEGNWVDSLTGDTGRIEFVSKQVLEVQTLYLVFLADDPLPRNLLSTNSLSERHRSIQLAREKKCARSQSLRRTIYKPSRFIDQTQSAEEFKTETWIEFPNFSENKLTEMVVKPKQLSIDGDVLSRDRFLREVFDEYKHQWIWVAGSELIVFRAADWSEYCEALIEAVSAKVNGTKPGKQADPAFCKKKF